jgi:hypothetical protein
MDEWARRGIAAGNGAPDPEGLGVDALARLERARARSAWSARYRRRFAMANGADLLAWAEQRRLTGMLDQQAVTVRAIGGVGIDPRHGDRHHARELVEQLFRKAASEGVDVAVLFADPDRFDIPDEFALIPAVECEFEVAESPRARRADDAGAVRRRPRPRSDRGHGSDARGALPVPNRA